MSIIVKGMKMPESCGMCFVGNRTICKNGCPLGVIPDKHGRLVDVDKCEDYFWEHLDDNGMAGAMNAINEMPTIVEAEDSE